eukprot:1009093-Pelagomonas_calceolata.AAC.1
MWLHAAKGQKTLLDVGSTKQKRKDLEVLNIEDVAAETAHPANPTFKQIQTMDKEGEVAAKTAAGNVGEAVQEMTEEAVLLRSLWTPQPQLPAEMGGAGAEEGLRHKEQAAAQS